MVKKEERQTEVTLGVSVNSLRLTIIRSCYFGLVWLFGLPNSGLNWSCAVKENCIDCMLYSTAWHSIFFFCNYQIQILDNGASIDFKEKAPLTLLNVGISEEYASSRQTGNFRNRSLRPLSEPPRTPSHLPPSRFPPPHPKGFRG